MATHSNAAKHAFYYLLVLFTLGFTTIGLGQILFQVINNLLPEVAPLYDDSFSEWVLRFGISSVIIAAPVYWLITHLINKDLEKKVLEKDSSLRKWLTYLILLASSITAIGLLIGTLNSFLGGEITPKFILKILSALLIAGVVFAYYFYDIRRETFEENRMIIFFRMTFFVVVLASVVLGFFFLQKPSFVRAVREDDERINRLRNISWRINDYYQENKILPQDFSSLDEKLFLGEVNDPVTLEPFSYRVVSKKTYELCATFAHSNKEKGTAHPMMYQDPDWIHAVGSYCFQKKITDVLKPQRY